MWQPHTWLAVRESEAEIHTWPRVLVHPNAVEDEGGMGAKRQWLHDREDRAVLVMMDDDFRFHVRTGQGWKLRNADPDDVAQALDWMVGQCLGQFAMSGLSLRVGNNRCDGFSKENTRCTGNYAIAVERCRAARLRWDRTPHGLMQDIDFTLQLLRRGLHNVVAYHWAVSQKTNSPGGASIIRTGRKQTDAARWIARQHPQAKLVVKGDDGSGMGTRLDVRVAWRKAAAEGSHHA